QGVLNRCPRHHTDGTLVDKLVEHRPEDHGRLPALGSQVFIRGYITARLGHREWPGSCYLSRGDPPDTARWGETQPPATRAPATPGDEPGKGPGCPKGASKRSTPARSPASRVAGFLESLSVITKVPIRVARIG